MVIRDILFRVRMKEKYSEKNIDLLIIMVILNFLSIFLICVSFNYRLYHSDPREIREPMLQFTFEYYDLYDNPYKDTIYISINNMSLKHNHRDEITVMAKLDEVNEEYKVKADENIQSKLAIRNILIKYMSYTVYICIRNNFEDNL